MKEAWADMLNELFKQYGKDEFNNDALALMQNVYYQGALAGTVILHKQLQAGGHAKTPEALLGGVNAFGQGLVNSVRQLHEAWNDAPYQVSKEVDKGYKH